MRPQLLGMAVLIAILGTMLACLASGRWLMNGEVNIINALASFENKQFGDFVSPNMFITWYNAAVTFFSWRYPFLSSPWAIFVKIPLWIISLMVIWALIEVGKSLIQGAASALRTILGP